jgi:hypothetical protein
LRNVCKSAVLEEAVLLVVLLKEAVLLDALVDETLPPASSMAETRLPKSVFSVARLLLVLVDDELEVVEPLNSDRRSSILLDRLE